MSNEQTRLDKWLWAVRFFKTRAEACATINGKGARILRHGQILRTHKPAFGLRVGDTVTIIRGRRVVVVQVEDLPVRRVSAAKAAACYRHALNEETDHA